MPGRRDNDERPGWLGYIAAIAASALLHAGIVVFALFVMPNLLHSETAPPPAYTVKIVDSLPAGDLGTHLPKLAGHKRNAPPPPQQMAKAEVPKPEEPKLEAPKPPPPLPEPKAEDKNAVALKTIGATPTPTPPPPPEAAPTAVPTPAPTPTKQKIAEPRHTPKPPPSKPPKKEQVHKNPKGKKEPVVVAKAEATPNIQQQLRKIREQLMKEHLKQQEENAEDEGEGDDEGESEEGAKPGNSGSGGPVVGSANTAGKGYGVGPGSGSAGELQDLQFLLYYRQVQQKIKDAWTFPGGSNDLTATVDFSIGPDGNLTGVKIGQSSGDSAFDDSVVRAIRKAAPFPPPPDKYRSEFQSGVAAMFRLGELKS